MAPIRAKFERWTGNLLVGFPAFSPVFGLFQNIPGVTRSSENHDDSRSTTGSVVGADGGQAVGYFLTVPGRRFSGGRID
jgi:hypothetical protein